MRWMQEQMLRAFKWRDWPKIFAGKEIHPVEELFYVSVEGMVEIDNLLSGNWEDVNGEIPVENMEMG